MPKRNAMLLLLFLSSPALYSLNIQTAHEMQAKQIWVKSKLTHAKAELPFSFVYDGQALSGLPSEWSIERHQEKLDAQRTRHTLSGKDGKTGLAVRCEAIEYHDFPTVEWTLYFKNTGSQDTPILSDIQALDTRFERKSGGEFVLHHHRGTTIEATDFKPLQTELGSRREVRIASVDGRPLSMAFPYFNLEWKGEGAIIVIGWPGQWAAQFLPDKANGIRVRAGQELTHFKLHPGEEVRTPLIVLQFWQGDRVHAQNVWRRWMIAHNLPRPGGKLPVPMLEGCSSHQFAEMIKANEENQVAFIDRYLEEGFKLDCWWMDAGWYVNETGWPNTGTWEVDAKRFPRGLRAVTDHGHSKGVNSIVWFEVERVTPGTWLYENHPEWLIGPQGKQKLLDLGNPAALSWLIEHVDSLIVSQRIDLYRQDFNIGPREIWRANDAPDRQGITEIGYVSGYLKYWDELRRRHPDLLIDTCASGGHRNDLETLRRAVPLLRSDYLFEPNGQQAQTFALASWMPYYGTGYLDHVTLQNSTIYRLSFPLASDEYLFRSIMQPSINMCIDVRRQDIDYPLLRKLTAQWREVADCYLGDFYPLTGYSLDDTQWMAWQFDLPEEGRGLVQAFRRAKSPYEVSRFRLAGLDPDARYSVANVDVSASKERTGRQLMSEGLQISLATTASAAVITYERAK